MEASEAQKLRVLEDENEWLTLSPSLLASTRTQHARLKNASYEDDRIGRHHDQ
ncbi:hypothetical protein [Granulicella sp. L60]|uniref:hypothetical protein n=1 Tax=Granulicella sp. L60 TaxID=1641866 RepID=UPI00131CB95E|nr:hypothetical protein [Granulicella sp. L60]